MYADLTESHKRTIIGCFHEALQRGATDPRHAAAIAAKDGLGLSSRAWNGKKGSNAYAAVLAVLVQEGVVNVEVKAGGAR